MKSSFEKNFWNSHPLPLSLSPQGRGTLKNDPSMLDGEGNRKWRGLFLSLLLLFVTHCSGADVTSTGTVTIENDFDINEGEAPDYDADADESGTGEGSTSGGDSGSGSTTGDASEDCAYQDVEASPKDIVFELGQLNPADSTGTDDSSRYECQTVTISGCYPFKAELVDLDSDSDPSTDTNIVIANSDGDISSLVEGEESFQVCCTHHNGIMNDKAQVNVFVGESSADYVFVINAECDTINAELITLNTPTEGQEVWEHTATTTTYEGLDFFTIDVQGTINIGAAPELKDILVKNDAGLVTLKFNVADQIQTWSFDPDNYESGTDAAFEIQGLIPSGLPDVYNVSVSVETTLGTFTESVNVVRLTEPELKVYVQDFDGNVISSTTESPETTSYFKVISGIQVGNLDVTGDMKLSLYIVGPDGSVSTLFEDKDYNTDDFEYGPETGIDGKCPGTFASGDSTYCTEYLPLTVFETGFNTVVAKACNDYTEEMYPLDHDDYGPAIESKGCILSETYVVTDTNLPQTTCSGPKEGQVFYEDEADNITLKCTLENFDETVLTTNSTTGQTEETCNVKLFVNSINLDGTEENVGTYKEICDDLEIVASADGSSTNGNTGNIRKATLEYTLNKNDLLKYNNFIQIVTKDNMGNQNYFTRSFIVTKDFNKFSKIYSKDEDTDELKKQLQTQPMGEITSTGSKKGATKGSPIMIKISEDTLTHAGVIKVLRKILNDNFDFIEMGVQGGALIDKNDNDEIDLNDFQAVVEEFDNYPTDEEKLVFIEQLLHKPNPYQIVALKLYRYLKNDGSAYFKFEDADDDEITALDACGQPLVLSTLPLNTLNYTQPYMTMEKIIDEGLMREWPIHICQQLLDEGVISDLKDCNTLEQGIWNIEPDLKNDGIVDLILTLDGKNGGPALYGNSVVYSLLDGGTTHNYNMPEGIQNLMEFFGTNAGITDPVVPLFFNIGQLKITLKDMLQVIKAQKGPDYKILMEEDSETGEQKPVACEDPVVHTGSHQNKGCSLYVYINGDKLKSTESSITFTAYDNCQKYFEEKYPGQELPWGCSNDNNQNWPLAIDMDSDQGYLLWSTVGFEGEDDALPALMIPALQNVFRGTFACIATQMVNPILDSKATPYPDWVPEEDKIDELAFALGTDSSPGDEATTFEINDNISFGMEDDIEDPLFSFKLNLAESDLDIYDGGITFKLLIDYLGASVKPGIGSSITSIPASITPQALGEFVKVLTRNDGFPYYSPDNLNFEDNYPTYGSATGPALGITLGLEPLGNAALSLMIAQGFQKILDAFDVGNIELVDAHTLRINRVSLSKMGRDSFDEEGGVCGIPPASTDFSNNLLIGDFAFLFKTTAMNLDIRLENPPTLAIENYDDGDETTTDDGDYKELQVGIPDLQIDFRDIEDIVDPDTNETRYQVGDVVFTARLDLVLRLVIKYEKVGDKQLGRLAIYVLPLEKQIILTDVIKQGASSGLGLDEGGFVKVLHEQLLQFFWKKLNSTPGGNPSFAITFPKNMSDFDDSITIKTDDTDEENRSVYQNLIEADDEGMIIENNTNLDPADKCDADEVYFYVDDPDAPSGGSSSGGSSSGGSSSGGSGSSGHGGGGTPDSFPIPGGGNGSGTSGGIITPGSGPTRYDIEQPDEAAEILDLNNPCNFVKADINNTTINEALCELGIDEIQPDLDFTFLEDGGYLSISVSAAIETYNWLSAEVNGTVTDEELENMKKEEVEKEAEEARKEWWEEQNEEDE